MPKLPTLQVLTLGFIGIVVAMLMVPQEGDAQSGERSGKEVAEAICAACHETGVNNAPKIGDVEAWEDRAALGLTALKQHALDGIRRMPAHGDHPQLTDLEIARAESVTRAIKELGRDRVALFHRNTVTVPDPQALTREGKLYNHTA
ncbi:MAG: Cytochrome c-555 [Gammaproteobacteria bacterium]|nr:Cytochrome c-555 [Gammaproteobacteria bacterium]